MPADAPPYFPHSPVSFSSLPPLPSSTQKVEGEGGTMEERRRAEMGAPKQPAALGWPWLLPSIQIGPLLSCCLPGEKCLVVPIGVFLLGQTASGRRRDQLCLWPTCHPRAKEQAAASHTQTASPTPTPSHLTTERDPERGCESDTVPACGSNLCGSYLENLQQLHPLQSCTV